MPKDETFREILTRTEAHVLRVEKKVDMVICNGCAHRPDDLRRIESLESWKNRGIVGVISVSVIAFLDYLGLM